ncbi:MAG: phosphoribosyl-AMP cyclohydrolase [Pseudomonadota bacterium]
MCFPKPEADKNAQEFGETLSPRFDSNGLVTAVTVHAETKQVLMVAHMNGEAIRATLDTGFATYWSRSRGKLWVKGETSGERQRVSAIYTDCDQDAFVVEVEPEGRGTACHNGFVSCFYRRVDQHDGAAVLTTIDQPKADPAELYAPKGD